MKIVELKWVRRSVNNTGFNIYRSNTPFTQHTLPPKLATVGPNITRYSDHNVVANQTYYYMVSSFNAYGERFGELTAISNTGSSNTPVGPTTFLGRTGAAGLYGEVASGTYLPTYAQLRTALNVTGSTSDVWIKFYIDGKILYFPKVSVAFVTIADMRTKNLFNEHVYTLNGYKYKVRLLSSHNGSSIKSPNGYPDPGWSHGSEWNRLLYPIIQDARALSRVGSMWANYTPTELQWNSSSNVYAWTKESNRYNFIRGGDGPSRTTAPITGIAHGWRPVLELIN